MYEDTEHIRRLNAMSKRILSIGKVSYIKKSHMKGKKIYMILYHIQLISSENQMRKNQLN